MRARHEKRYGITGAKPVNTAGGVTMLKPKPSGLPMAGSEPEPAPVAGAMGNLRLDKQARGGRKFIAGAIKHPGRMKEGAKREGVSTHEYMEEHKGSPGGLGAAARLGLRLSAMSKKKK